MRSLDSVVHEIVNWQRRMFPRQDLVSTVNHLVEEVGELRDRPSDPAEIADCFLLLLAIADRASVDLANAALEKHNVNLSREWIEQPDGSFRHASPSVVDIKPNGGA